jgi:hypothetical protein
MGLTIHWDWRGPKSRDEVRAVVEQLRQRALDLPFESVGDIAHFEGDNARSDQGSPDDDFHWLKIQARHILLSKNRTLHWDCFPSEIVGFEILVAPGSEPMEAFLATYPTTIQVEGKRLRTERRDWCGRGSCKTQYASDPQFGGAANFLRAHLSVCRMLDHAKELGLVVEVSDEGEFFEKRDVQVLVKEVGQWNAQIAAFVGAIGDLGVKNLNAPIRSFPNYEHLEAKGQNKIDALLRALKEPKTT